VDFGYGVTRTHHAFYEVAICIFMQEYSGGIGLVYDEVYFGDVSLDRGYEYLDYIQYGFVFMEDVFIFSLGIMEFGIPKLYYNCFYILLCRAIFIQFFWKYNFYHIITNSNPNSKLVIIVNIDNIMCCPPLFSGITMDTKMIL